AAPAGGAGLGCPSGPPAPGDRSPPPRRHGCCSRAAASPTAAASTAGTGGSRSRRRGFLKRRDALGRHGPVIGAAVEDGVGSHPPDIEQPGLAIARSQVHDGAVLRDLVVNRLAVMPFL